MELNQNTLSSLRDANALEEELIISKQDKIANGNVSLINQEDETAEKLHEDTINDKN